jgi:hypothetical protein
MSSGCPPGQVTDGLQSSQVVEGPPCGSSYLRPSGGSFMPWIYLALLILIQAPTTLRRVRDWEKARALALVLTLFHEFIQFLAYRSTQLAPEKVLIWAPLTLILDAGAMMQLVVLLVEKYGSELPLLGRWIKDSNVGTDKRVAKTSKCNNSVISSTHTNKQPENGISPQPHPGGLSGDSVPGASYGNLVNYGNHANDDKNSFVIYNIQTGKCNNSVISLLYTKPHPSSPTGDHLPGSSDDNPGNSSTPHPRTKKELVFAGLVIVSSFLLLLAAIALQITAIHFARLGLQDENLEVSWCSPAFYSSGVAIQDADCNWKRIHITDVEGIGCVQLPATASSSG